MALFFSLGVCVLASAAWSSDGLEVREVTIATPDIIGVEIRDPPFKPGTIVQRASPGADHSSWTKRGGEWALVIGSHRDHMRTSDTPPAVYLDRRVIDDATQYGAISGRKVIGVFRKSVPYDSGIFRSDYGSTSIGASFKHYVYLKLDSPLTKGEHVIKWPARLLPDTTFDFDERTTRASAIRVNQNGYRPDDEGKIAYLSFWLPGGPNNGVVDFRQSGLKAFHIVDAGNAIVFSSEFGLVRSPDDPEQGNGLTGGLLDYPSLNGKPVKPSAVLPRNPIEFSAAGHGFQDGQTVRVAGFAGGLDKLNGHFRIVNAKPNQFALMDVDGRSMAASGGQIGTIAPAFRANRAGTFVFRLDFSQWRPAAEGDYRVFVPGLGVSDRFRVGEQVWQKAAQTSFAGLYHHRSGIEIDGRFGYRRPAAFRPGPNFTIFQSKLPLVFSSESGTGFLPFTDGVSSAWLQGQADAADLWGGYMDAGDWDRRINHIEISYALMDLVEHGSARARTIALGIPKSSELLNKELYAGTDDLPDLLHEAIWNIDFFRRLQLPDGRVRGGIESAKHPLIGEPSYLESQLVFVYAPDHISGYRYAAAAAKLSRILAGLNKTSLAKVYHDSAVSAWKAAETGFNAPDDFYSTAIRTAREASALPGSTWDAKKAVLQSAAAENRAAAAASLYRLTQEPMYKAVFEQAWKKGMELFLHNADGAWDYLHASADKADTAIQQAIRLAFIRAAEPIVSPQATATYMNLKHAFAPAGWGQGLAPDANAVQLLMRAHMLTGDSGTLKAMQFGSAHILGANQVGLSFTTGLGARNVLHPLHEDHRAMGVPAPAGITLYGWAPQAQTSYDWVFGADWAPLSEVAMRNGVAYKRVEPDRFAMPYYEYMIEHPSVIMQQEYTVHQTIGSTAALWTYLHGVDRRQAR